MDICAYVEATFGVRYTVSGMIEQLANSMRKKNQRRPVQGCLFVKSGAESGLYIKMILFLH
jgi:hypothetical protein